MTQSQAMKKKVSQEELRRLMAVHRGRTGAALGASGAPARVCNPLAKYDEAGGLSCVLCRTAVRSEAAWPAHLNSQRHRDHIIEAKRLKELTAGFTAPRKRAATPPRSLPEKKVKGILKNAVQRNIPDDFFHKPSPPTNSNVVLSQAEEIKRTPLKPFLDKIKDEPQTSKSAETEIKTELVPDQPIPEGFFDDPVLDAKARNIEYKDPIEEEWEKFQKEMKEETSASAEIIAGEQEEATAERQIDEIDEQIRNWSRVLDLELKKEETTKIKQEHASSAVDQNENASGSDTDIDEYLDWRAKKSFR